MRDWKKDPVTTFPFAPHSPFKTPPELADNSALMLFLGTTQAEFDLITTRSDRMYSTFAIAKRGGGERYIDAPDDRLKFLQRKLLPLLEQFYRARGPVHGFTKGKSVISNANAHLRKKYILNIDLEKFFPSISKNRVSGLFRSIGIDPNVANSLAAICCRGAILPQGAPTSPIISNMVCFRLDREFMRFAKNNRAIYTRYADDITFSSFQPMNSFFSSVPVAGRMLENSLSLEFLMIFMSNGFKINEKKIYFADKHSRKIVTGIKVNELLNVDRRYIRNLRSIIRSVEISGLANAQCAFTAKGFRGSIIQHIRGRLEWLSNLKGRSDPVVRSLIVRFNGITSGSTIDIAPTQTEQQARAVWVTEDAGNQGTLFFLKDFGLVTAAHCVKNKKKVKIFHPSKHSNTFEAKVEKICPHRDLAVLSHSVPKSEYYELEICKIGPSKGDHVSSLGYPAWDYGDTLNVRPGVISLMTSKSAVKMIEVSNKLGRGMSGGPVLDGDGQVIGIIHKGGKETDRDFAVHVEELVALAASGSP